MLYKQVCKPGTSFHSLFTKEVSLNGDRFPIFGIKKANKIIYLKQFREKEIIANK